MDWAKGGVFNTDPNRTEDTSHHKVSVFTYAKINETWIKNAVREYKQRGVETNIFDEQAFLQE